MRRNFNAEVEAEEQKLKNLEKRSSLSVAVDDESFLDMWEAITEHIEKKISYISGQADKPNADHSLILGMRLAFDYVLAAPNIVARSIVEDANEIETRLSELNDQIEKRREP